LKVDWQLPQRTFVCAFLSITFLCTLRLLRQYIGTKPAEKFSLFEVIVSVFAIICFIVFGCTPYVVRCRSGLVDLRFIELEAAINSMLDALRPLLREPFDGCEPGVHTSAQRSFSDAALPSSGRDVQKDSQCKSKRYFSVRVITSRRLTLRANLQVNCNSDDLTAGCYVASPLSGFQLAAARVAIVTPTDLGRHAAASLMGSAHALARHRRESRSQGWGRQDDDVSVSGVSISTASTLRRNGHQVDEASLSQALNLVTGICARQYEPLELLRTSRAGSLVPTKATVDEPAALLGFANDQLSFVRAEALPGADWHASESARQCVALRGIVRDFDEVELLCKSAEDSDTESRSEIPVARKLVHLSAERGPVGTTASSSSSSARAAPCSMFRGLITQANVPCAFISGLYSTGCKFKKCRSVGCSNAGPMLAVPCCHL